MPLPLAWEAAVWGSRGGAPQGLVEAGMAERPQAFSLMAALYADAAHTLGNPLTGLTLSLERLEHHALEPRHERIVARLRQAAGRLGDIKALWAQLGDSQRGAWARPLVLDELLAWAKARPPMPQRPLTLRHSGPMPPLSCVSAALWWAIEELQDNIERHGHGPMGIEVQTVHKAVRLCLWQGHGALLAEHIGSLWRAPLPRTRGGQGLGLVQVAFVVEELHHGQVAYVPGAQGGCAFFIDLPVQGAFGG